MVLVPEHFAGIVSFSRCYLDIWLLVIHHLESQPQRASTSIATGLSLLIVICYKLLLIFMGVELGFVKLPDEKIGWELNCIPLHFSIVTGFSHNPEGV